MKQITQFFLQGECPTLSVSLEPVMEVPQNDISATFWILSIIKQWKSWLLCNLSVP